MNRSTIIHALTRGIRLLAVAALLGALVNVATPPPVAHAATITVNTTADELNADGDCSLREAIQAANTNAAVDNCTAGQAAPNLDTIIFAAATDGTPITLTIAPDATPDDNQDGDLDILAGGGDLTIQGNGAANTIIDGGGIDRVFHVCPGGACGITVILDNVTIQNGHAGASFGGGIYNNGAMMVDASTVISNTANSGGGICNWFGSTTVDASTVIYNTADFGGGIYNLFSTTTVDASTVISNTATFNGGGIYNNGTTTVDASTVSANTATNDGGGIYNWGTLTVQNGSTIGGAGAGNTATMGSGGGIYNFVGTTTVDGSTVSANTVALDGGGIYNSATLTVTNGSTIGGAGAGNTATMGSGGGILNFDTTTVDASTVSANTAYLYGGGIYNWGTLTVQNGSTIGGAGAGNTATTGSGGGIYQGSLVGTTTVTGSRILYNTATNDGGGVDSNRNVAGATSVTGSCIVGNSASSFRNNQAAQQTATGNWWGAATGPNTLCADTTGGNVDTSSYLGAPILGCPSGCSDLQVDKANDTGGNGTVGTAFNWTLAVSNPGGAYATFNAGQRILDDDLPAGPTYGAPTPGNFTSITNSGNIHCNIAANTLTCDATGGSVTMGAITGRFDVVFSVTPNASGVLTNPVAAGNCRVDPDGNVTESDETNNDCSANSVTVTAPSITVTKQASVSSAGVGETITYTYRVTNTGDVTLNPVSANDDWLGAISLGSTSLALGASTSGTATYVVQESDLPGPLANTVTVTGTPPTGPDVTATANASVALVTAPSITVTKQASVSSAGVGETITYTYRVTNTGDVTLNPVSANDDRLGAISLGSTSLALGASTSGTATYVVQESDLPGPLANTVTVTGTPPTGPDVTATANALVALVTLRKVYLPLILRSYGP